MPGEEALGQKISVLMNSDNPFGEIIGVVGDVKEDSVDKGPEPTAYYVHAHLNYSGMVFAVRTQGSRRLWRSRSPDRARTGRGAADRGSAVYGGSNGRNDGPARAAGSDDVRGRSGAVTRQRACLRGVPRGWIRRWRCGRSEWGSPVNLPRSALRPFRGLRQS